MARAAAAVLVASVASSLVGCSKKKPEADAKAKDENAQAAKKRPEGDRYADGQRLTAALKDWARRWTDTNDLPACDPLLSDAAELQLCTTAQAALTTMKAAAAKPEAEAVLIHDAAELAFATEAASEKLRNASMKRLEAQRQTATSSSATPDLKPPRPPGFGTFSKARPLGSSGKAAIIDQLEGKKKPPRAEVDPAMRVMQAYSRANRASLRYLSQFLQFGPLATRGAAFAELESLSKRKEAWPALGRTLREAAMTESDRSLQGKLKALAPKLSRRFSGGRPGMPPRPAPLAPPAGGTPPPAAAK